jgi:oligopeptide transport system permease protein
MNEQQKKSKFSLANRENIRFDEEFKTKPIGYYKDAWLRFKRNKASVVAAIIMILLVFMAIVGPWIKDDRLYKNSETLNHAQKLVSFGELPPKINGLEWLPMFDGKRNIVRSSIDLDIRPLESEVVVETFGKILYSDIDKIKPKPDGTYSVVVDFYNYVNYRISSDWVNLSTDELNKIFDTEEEKGVQIILEEHPTRVYRDPITGELIPGQNHRVKINYFTFLEEVYDYIPNYWFGSDQRGRDWFYTLWNGARISLLVAFSVSIINILIGVIIGSISGYFGGSIDLIIERISEIIGGIPLISLITLLILRYGSSIGIVILAFTLTGWLGIASTTRREFYRYKNREYVLAARTLGSSDVRIMSRHILPNAVGTLITSFVLYIPSVIFTESTFSYLQIINYGNVTSVGRMLSDAQTRLKTETSLGFLVLYPAFFVSLLMLSFNLFGNGLRDAFNPSLRGVE